jgi:ribosomal protein S18 acetylase RimI-like enzyme
MTHTPFDIQLATPNEAADVAALVDAAYSKWVEVIGGKPMPMLADYPALVDKGFVHTVHEAGILVGVLVIWQIDDALYIDNVAVHPDHQRRGIGDLLLAFTEQQARAMGLHKLTLLTNEKMESNQAYYLKHRYVETRRETLPNGRRAVWMHKAL